MLTSKYYNLKKKLPIFLLFLSSLLGFGQDAELDENTWFAYSITDQNGTVTEKPFTPEMTVQMEIDLTNNILSGDLCCAGNFQMNIDLQENFTFEGSNFTNTLGNCNETENNDFAELVYGFFENNTANTFSYIIIEESNLVSRLEITNASDETFLFYNTPHVDKNSKVLLQTWGYDWRLNSMNINGNFYSFDTPNQDFGEITAVFNYDGSFETEICGNLQGKFTIGNDNGAQGFLFNCGNISSTLISCDTAESTTIQDLYFSFFTSNNEEILLLDYTIIDGQTGPCEAEVFQLSNSTGDYLEFSSCSLLNVEENKKPSLSFYPNPTDGVLNLSFFNNQQINQIQVLDMNGKLVKNYTQTNKQIDISELPSGIYFLKLNLLGKSLVKKIVKQ